MPQSYLCTAHRLRLEKDSQAAEETWRLAYARCLEHPESAADRVAIHLAGCAYEAAHLLATIHSDRSRRGILRLSSSAQQLIVRLGSAGETRAVRETIGMTVSTLQTLLGQGTARDLVMAACRTLMHAGAESLSTARRSAQSRGQGNIPLSLKLH